MAGFEKDHNNNLRVCFKLPAIDERIRVSLGVKSTKENRRWAKKAILEPLEKEIAACDYEAILRRFPKLKVLMERGLVQIDKTVGTKMTDLFDMVRDDYRANQKKNAHRIESTMKHPRKYFEAMLAVDCTVTVIGKYREFRKSEGAANASINRELSALHRGFVLGQEIGRVKDIPPVHKLPEASARSGFFERHEFERVVAHLPDYLRPVAWVAYLTGWRRGEIVSREDRHLDLEAGWIRLEPGETKNNQPRNFPLYPELRTVLEKQVADNLDYKRTTGRLFPWLFHRYGQRIKTFDTAWNDACEAAGVKRLFHDLRRTAVRNFVRANIPQVVAKQLSGHLTDSVFRRYAIVDEVMLREGAERLAAAREKLSQIRGVTAQKTRDPTFVLSKREEGQKSEEIKGLSDLSETIQRPIQEQRLSGTK